MRTKQPARSKRDHFMYLDSMESDLLEPTLVLIKPKQAAKAQSSAKLMDILGHEASTPSGSPTSIWAPMLAPPPINLPAVVDMPSLPSTSVWGSNAPTLKRVWASPREDEVTEEWLDEVALQTRAKMILKGASFWPQKDREQKIKHRRLNAKYWMKRREEKKKVEHAALFENEVEAWADDEKLPVATLSQKSLYLLHKNGGRKPARENAPRRARVRRDQRRASRSARSFAFDDVEQQSWPMQHKEMEYGAIDADATAATKDLNLAWALLSCEPMGPALADLFTHGVPLSIDATKDLAAMLEHKKSPKTRRDVAKPPQLEARGDKRKNKAKGVNPTVKRGKRGC